MRIEKKCGPERADIENQSFLSLINVRQGLDEELDRYLCQLVQVIKHQDFFDTPLVHFLLGRPLPSCILF